MSPSVPIPAHWTADANESLRLSLVRAKDDKASLTAREAYEGFHPTFTYPIFGEDEKIYGYRDLSIDLKFASGSLAQFLHVQYAEKLPSSSAIDDIEATLSKFIPKDYYTSEPDFLARVEADALTFTPPGTRVFAYARPARALSRKGKHVAIPQVLSPEDEETVEFEVYHSTWATPGFREYHRRMQLFVLLYIEAGSFIREDEDTWEFVVLYEKRRRRADPSVATYHFVGYATLYPFYCYPERVRMRISQFVILPPYQQEGHGSALYTAIYQHVLATPHIAELTVEDPAEAFEDLRDRNDLKMLLADERFMREALGERWAGGGGGRVVKGRGTRGLGGYGTRNTHVRGGTNGVGLGVGAGLGAGVVGLGFGLAVGNGVGNGNGNGAGDVDADENGAVGAVGAHGNGNSNGNSNGNGAVRGRAAAKRGKMGPPADKAWLEKWRVELKLASRQFHRLIEMLILRYLDSADAKAQRAYRLQVKERLFRFNYDALSQLDKKERQLKLDETFQSVREDYERILALVH